jgi:hypothetical protein
MKPPIDCIVRICTLTSEREICGAGFLVTERHIVTCAHVLAQALGVRYDRPDIPDGEVLIDFITASPSFEIGLSKSSQTARVIFWAPRKDDGKGDIAVLELRTDCPVESQPARLATAQNVFGHAFWSYGFPPQYDDGTWGYGMLVAHASFGVQISSDPQYSFIVQPGFSGAPVWDEQAGSFVGMIVTADTRSAARTAFMIPTNALLTAWPKLDNYSLRKRILELEKRKSITDFVKLAANIYPQVKATSSESGNAELDAAFDLSEGSISTDGNVLSSLPEQSSDLLDALRQIPQCVLIGEPGAGKTNTIERLEYEAAKARLDNHHLPVPFFCRLSHWDNEPSPLEFIRKYWPFAVDLETLFSQGQVILYLDGLNEMGDSGPHKANLLRRWIHSDNGPKQVIVTCRSSDYRLKNDLQLGLPVVEAEEMDDISIRQLVANYFESANDINIFLNQIFPSKLKNTYDSSDLLHLARNPLLLSGLIRIYKSPDFDGRLAQNTGLLFDTLSKMMWNWREIKCLPGWKEFSIAQSRIAKFAFAMINCGQPTQVPSTFALEYIKDKDLFYVIEKSGIIQNDGDKVRFYHQRVQEYFAAIELSHIGLDTKLVNPKIQGGTRIAQMWDGVIVAYCGIASDPDQVMEQVLSVDPYLAAMCFSSGIMIKNTQLVKDAVKVLIQDIDRLFDFKDRASVARKSLILFGDESVDDLLGLVEKEDHISERAVEVLDEIGSANALSGLEKLRVILEERGTVLTKGQQTTKVVLNGLGGLAFVGGVGVAIFTRGDMRLIKGSMQLLSAANAETDIIKRRKTLLNAINKVLQKTK